MLEYEYGKNTKKHRIPRLHQFCERFIRLRRALLAVGITATEEYQRGV